MIKFSKNKDQNYLSMSQAGVLFGVAGIFLVQTYAEIEQLSWVALASLFFLLTLSLVSDPEKATSLFVRPTKLQSSSECWLSSLIIVVPISAYMILTWSSEFPFGGDHITHIAQAFRTGVFWIGEIGTKPINSSITVNEVLQLYIEQPALALTSRIFLLLLGSLIIALCIFYRQYTLSCLLALIFLVVAGFADQSTNFRWPTLSYFLSIPWTALGLLFDWDNLWNGLRLHNVLSLLVWLFVLRPYCVGFWPDKIVVPFGIMFFWLPQNIILFTSVYLESWALILVATALEAACRRGRNGYAISLFLVGAAAIIKEPAILVLPIVFLLCKTDTTSAVSNNSRHFYFRRMFLDISLLLASAIPFFTYFLVRTELGSLVAGVHHSSGVGIRTWKPSFDALGTETQVSHFFTDLSNLYSGTSWAFLIIFILLVVISYISTVNLHQTISNKVSILIIGAFGTILFFALDSSAPSLVGYPRFIVWPLLLFFSISIITFQAPNHLKSLRKLKLALLSILIVYQISNLVPFYSRLSSPDWSRNFEVYQQSPDPIYLPIKYLIKTHSLNISETTVNILANRPDQYVVNNRYGSFEKLVTFVNGDDLVCTCSTQHPYVMLMTIYSNDYLQATSTSQDNSHSRASRWKATQLIAPQCLSSLKRSCNRISIVNTDGTFVGALGSLE